MSKSIIFFRSKSKTCISHACVPIKWVSSGSIKYAIKSFSLGANLSRKNSSPLSKQNYFYQINVSVVILNIITNSQFTGTSTPGEVISFPIGMRSQIDSATIEEKGNDSVIPRSRHATLEVVHQTQKFCSALKGIFGVISNSNWTVKRQIRVGADVWCRYKRKAVHVTDIISVVN